MITLSIDVTKIDKTRIIEGKKGKYLDLVLFPNKGGEDEYGNHGFVKQGSTKEERASKQYADLPILGNYKDRDASSREEKSKPPANEGKSYRKPPPESSLKGDDVPF